jgi:copper chaperone CopZ
MRTPLPRLGSIGLLAASFALSLGLAGCCDDCSSCKSEPSEAPVESPDATAAAKVPPTVAVPWRGAGDTVELTVWELYCPGCVKAIETRVGALEGVVSAKATKGSGTLVVKLQDAASRDAVIAKIREAVHAEDKIVLGEDPLPASKKSGA